MSSINKSNPPQVLPNISKHISMAVVPSGAFTKLSDNSRTHEGGLAPVLSDYEMLRRAVLSCFLWEDQFYESGVDIAARICSLMGLVSEKEVYDLALEAKNVMKLRHVPLLLAVEMTKHPEHKKLVGQLLYNIIQRPDDITEVLSLYWRNNLQVLKDDKNKFLSQRFAKNSKLPQQIVRGCRKAFSKFDQYQMLKWQEKSSSVTMRDAIRLLHPDPTLAVRNSKNVDTPMAEVYKGILNGTAIAVETWESKLQSEGKAAKKDIFTKMIQENSLGSFALITNLRGMIECGVDLNIIREGIKNMNVERILPFKFITAARFAPSLKAELQEAMFRCVKNIDHLPGKSVLLVDISGSMSSPISRVRNGRPSDLRRIDAAAALCILAQSICEHSEIYLFNNYVFKIEGKEINLKNVNGGHPKSVTSQLELNGFTLSEKINSMVSGGTDMANAVTYINANEQYDRLIVFSDDESNSRPPSPTNIGYGVNVASGSCGVTYDKWIHINGFSEGVLHYIKEYEKFLKNTSETS